MRPEEQAQIQLVEWADMWFRTQHPEYMMTYEDGSKIAPLIAIPNEGKRSPQLGKKMKRMGLRPGFHDLMLLVASGGYRGLIIEMKIKPNTVNPNQRAWAAWYIKNNYKSAVCWSFDEAKNAIEKYMRGVF